MAARFVPPSHVAKAIVYAVGICAGVYVFAVIVTAPAPPALDDRNCPVGAQVGVHTIVLVDNTDPFTSHQIAVFKSVVRDLVRGARAGGMISVGTIRTLPARASLSLCSPGDAPPPSFGDLWRHPNESYLDMKARFDVGFDGPMKALTDQMPLNTTAATSPIVQSIGGVVAGLGRDWTDAGERRLVVFSDLMENVPGYSHYDHVGNAPPQPYAVAVRQAPYLARDVDLRGVAVEVRYMTGLRQGLPFQGSVHKAFWDAWFRAHGAASVTFVDLPLKDPAGMTPCTTRSTCSGPSSPPPSGPPRGPT